MPRMLKLAIAALMLALPASAHAFCGFYVAQAGARLFNNASRVVLARNDNATVVTMEANYQGAPSQFAMVVPIPTVLRRDQIRVVEPGLIDRIDNYSAPRLVEYNDPDPCARIMEERDMAAPSASMDMVVTGKSRRANALGVRIEARYQVGEYDILILSARQSGGLVTWLTQNGYTMPPGAAPVVGSYLRQNMKFFVAKVNLRRRAAAGASETLRPLQLTYNSRKFMLPIRLGTVNANGPQEMFVFALTPNGRVETTNYRTVKLPSDQDIPAYTKGVFPSFYKAAFTRAVRREGPAVFLEYAWDAGSCDPCSSEPPSQQEMRQLGVNWLGEGSVFFTRLHLRYTRQTFPEDLVLQETSDSSNFQARYVMHHPFKGEIDCKEGQAYRNMVVERWDREARNLAQLTGWPLQRIKADMRRNGDRPSVSVKSEQGWLASAWEWVGGLWRA